MNNNNNICDHLEKKHARNDQSLQNAYMVILCTIFHLCKNSKQPVIDQLRINFWLLANNYYSVDIFCNDDDPNKTRKDGKRVF